jgi:uncharacterized iron-regulated membrane protein
MVEPALKHRVREMWMAVHRYCGLVILVFLGFAALTGSALVMMQQIDEALNADLFRQPAATHPADVPQTVDRFRAEHPEFTVQSFPLAVTADARIPVKVVPVGGADPTGPDQVFLDRATGAVAAARSTAPAPSRHGAARLLHDIHYTLMLGDYGRWFMGVVALAWLVSNFVGAYLTLPPRGPLWKQWKRTWRFSLRSAFPRQMMDLHRASGLWLFVPLTLLALTSVCMNFFAEGYDPLVERLVPEQVLPLPHSEPSGPLSFASATVQAQRIADGMGEGWRPATVLYDSEENRIGVTLTDNGVLNYRRLGPIYLYFEAQTGRLAEVVDPYHGNTHLAWIRVLYPVHSGRIAGLPTLVLVFVSGLAIFAMCATGVYLWWKKRPSRKGRRGAARSPS